MKTKTLIIYEDGRPDLESTARSAAEKLDPERHDVKLRCASSVSIPDILASNVYLLGAESPKSPSYAELARVLAGINLAGRKAAFFGTSGAAVAFLREMCSDAELAFVGQDLVNAKPDQSALSAWLRAID